MCFIARLLTFRMPAYTSMRIADLRLYCEDRGVDHTGLTKKQIIDELRRLDDVETDQQDQENDSHNVESDADEASDVDEYESIPEAETPEIKALKLRLKLAREQRLVEESRERQLAAGAHAIRGSNGQNNHFDREVRNYLPRLQSDPVAFFNAYERVLILHDVPRSEWYKLLTPCLNEKATQVYAKLSLQQARDYDTIRSEILAAYKLDAAAYLANFRSARRNGRETYMQFAVRLEELLTNYLQARDISSYDDLKSEIIAEQFISVLPADVKAFVMAKRVTNVHEMAEEANLAFEIHREKQKNSGDSPGGRRSIRFHLPAGFG